LRNQINYHMLTKTKYKTLALARNLKKAIVWISMVFVILIISCPAFTQVDDCIISFGQARDMYNTGRFNEVLETLTPCLENVNALKQVSKSTRVEIFRLAALCCFMTGQTEQADQYTRQVLAYQPDYKSNPRDDDLAEFTTNINSLMVIPKLSVGVDAGTVIPMVKLVDQYSAVDPVNQSHSISDKPGIHGRIRVEYTITKSLSIGFEPGYTYIPLEYKVNHTENDTHNYDLELAYMELPIMIRYRYYNNSSFIPNAYAGALGRYMVTSFNKSDALGNYWRTKADNTNGILSSFLVSTKNFGFLAGAGVDYKLKNSAISVDVRYIFNMTSPGNKSNFDSVSSYDDISNSEEVYFTDHIGLISVSCLQISLGYRYFLTYKVF